MVCLHNQPSDKHYNKIGRYVYFANTRARAQSGGSGGCAGYWYTTNAGPEVVWIDKKGFFVMEIATNVPVFKLVRYSYK